MGLGKGVGGMSGFLGVLRNVRHFWRLFNFFLNLSPTGPFWIKCVRLDMVCIMDVRYRQRMNGSWKGCWGYERVFGGFEKCSTFLETV